jgi:hypothetical protein
MLLIQRDSITCFGYILGATNRSNVAPTWGAVGARGGG